MCVYIYIWFYVRFISKAAIITPEDQINADGSATDPWKLCSIQQIEEVKCVLRVIPIWVAGVMYYVTVVQEQNYVVFQALQSNRKLGNTNFHIPAASYILFAMLVITIWLPIYDRLIVPRLRTLTGKEDGLTLLQKMGIGLVLSTAAMLISGLVEGRRKTFLDGKSSSMSGMWLIPQISISGLSEAFALIGENELLYKQFPENMRSIASAFLFVGLAVSAYLSSFFTSVIHRTTNWLADDLNRGKLDYFYYSIAGMQILNLGFFLVCAKWYRYKERGEDTINTLQCEIVV